MAEGDCLSNVVLWLDYATIATRLLEAAVRDSDYSSVGALVCQVSAYQAAAYDAARMRVDYVSMTLLNRPAAELYYKTTRMELESTTKRSTGIKFLRKSNAAMLTVKAKAIATKSANQPGGGANSSDAIDKSSTKQKAKSKSSFAGGRAKDNSTQKQGQKSAPNTNNSPQTRPSGAPQGAASSAAEASGRTRTAEGI